MWRCRVGQNGNGGAKRNETRQKEKNEGQIYVPASGGGNGSGDHGGRKTKCSGIRVGLLRGGAAEKKVTAGEAVGDGDESEKEEISVESGRYG